MAAPVLPEFEVTRLTCRAPHADPKKKGQPCGSILGDVPGSYEYVTNAEKAPHEPDGFTWLRCPRDNCRRWNKWKLVVTTPTVPEGSIEERLKRFPENQQQAIMALAGGMREGQVAKVVGVSDRWLRKWKENPEFQALRIAIAPSLSAAHIRTALEALMTLIEKEAKGGRGGTHIRYLLNRTMFAEFERERAASKGNIVNLNVAQHQQQTSATVKSVWEERQRAIPAAVASED